MPAASAPRRVQQFLNYTAGTVQRSLRMANAVCAEYQADGPSTLLASLLTEQCEVPLHLVWLRPPDLLPEARDQARGVARRLNLGLVEVRCPAETWASASARAELLSREGAAYANRLVTLRGARNTFAPRADVSASHLEVPEDALGGLGQRFRLQYRHPFEDGNLRRFLSVAPPPGPGPDTPPPTESLLDEALLYLGMGPPPAPSTAGSSLRQDDRILMIPRNLDK